MRNLAAYLPWEKNAFRLELTEFTSSILAPIYLDYRILLSHHETKDALAYELIEKIREKTDLDFDAIAGMGTSGVSLASVIGFILKKDTVTILKEPKEHGTKKQIEGISVKKKDVILVDDVFSLGTTTRKCTKVIREEGGKIENSFVFLNYSFPQVANPFEGVYIHSLTNGRMLFDAGYELGKLSKEKYDECLEWLLDPFKYTEERERVALEKGI